MRMLVAALMISLAGPAIAEPGKQPARAKATKQAVTQPAKKSAVKPSRATRSNDQATSTCKKTRAGKGKPQTTTCTISAELEVKAGAPKPRVDIIGVDGRAVTGRPKSEDRLQGLGPHTK
jgi:hypothetical protein